MSQCKVAFEDMPWVQVRPGVRHKVHREGARQLRLVDFSTSDGDPHWCEQGHIGYVLKGGLTIDVGGHLFTYEEGDALLIPPGKPSAHRGMQIVPGTLLFMIEDV